MKASILTDLLLELNVINAKDIDREMTQLAAGVYDPRAAAWMKRVARYFLINIEQLLEPRKVAAEPRGGSRYQGGHEGAEVHGTSSKYHFQPSGKWRGRGPDTALSMEPSAFEPEEWRTQLHQPGVKKQIGQSFAPFEPKKAKAKGILWGPPTKKKLDPWMKGYKGTKQEEPEAGTPEAAKAEYSGNLYHFDPIVVRRRELFMNFQNTANYLNWVYTIAQRKSDDAAEQAQAQESNLLLRKLETMKTADLDGFNEVMQQTQQFMNEVRDDPEKFSSNKPTITMKFPDGFAWVHLHTLQQFKLEGERMSHCIGGNYFNKFEAGTHDYYSLRNPQGVPKITIEVQRTPPEILQIRAYANARPAPEYQPYLRPFITRMRFDTGTQEEFVD